MRAYLIPIAVCEVDDDRFAIAFMQRKDHHLGRRLADMLLAIGGALEPGEDARTAVVRELEEEVPGWLELDPASVEHLFSDDSITVFVAPGDPSAASARTFIQSTREGIPAILSAHAVRALADDRWVYPQMKAPLLARLEALERTDAR